MFFIIFLFFFCFSYLFKHVMITEHLRLAEKLCLINKGLIGKLHTEFGRNNNAITVIPDHCLMYHYIMLN